MIDSEGKEVYEKPNIGNLTVKRLIKLVNKLVAEFTDARTPYYRWNIDYLTESEDVIIEIDVQEDSELSYAYEYTKDVFGALAKDVNIRFSELSYAYEYTKDVFGALAKDVNIRFNQVEKDGHQHWVEITLNGDIDLGEGDDKLGGDNS